MSEPLFSEPFQPVRSAKPEKAAKWTAEGLSQGWQWLGQDAAVARKSAYRHIACGQVQQHEMSHMRIGKARCPHCVEAAWRREAQAQGWQWLGQVSDNHAAYRHMACGCERLHKMCHMRVGEVACLQCKALGPSGDAQILERLRGYGSRQQLRKAEPALSRLATRRGLLEQIFGPTAKSRKSGAEAARKAKPAFR